MRWELLHTGYEGDDFKLDNVSIWEIGWKRTSEALVCLPAPAFGQETRLYDVIEVETSVGVKRIAVAELSNLVFRFYVWRA
jgi:hypothetical protein